MTISTDELMTVGEVATYLHVSPAMIYRLAQTGHLPAFKIGRTWRFRQALIDSWLDDRRAAPPLADVEQIKSPNT